MHIGHRPERRLAGGSDVDESADFVAVKFAHVGGAEFAEDVVGMLAIDQRETVIGFAGLQQLGEAAMGRGS